MKSSFLVLLALTLITAGPALADGHPGHAGCDAMAKMSSCTPASGCGPASAGCGPSACCGPVHASQNPNHVWYRGPAPSSTLFGSLKGDCRAPKMVKRVVIRKSFAHGACDTPCPTMAKAGACGTPCGTATKASSCGTPCATTAKAAACGTPCGTAAKAASCGTPCVTTAKAAACGTAAKASSCGTPCGTVTKASSCGTPCGTPCAPAQAKSACGPKKPGCWESSWKAQGCATACCGRG